MNVIHVISAVLVGLTAGGVHALLFEKSMRARYQSAHSAKLSWIWLIGSRAAGYAYLALLGIVGLFFGTGIFLTGGASFMLGFWLRLYKTVRGAA